MKRTLILLYLFFLILPIFSEHKNNIVWPVLSGKYLGQKPVGPIPEIFAPGIISFGFHELRITFSPEGDETFYVTMDSSYMHRILVNIKRTQGIWSEPQLVPFAWDSNNGSPSFSPDGHRVYFASNRDNPHIIRNGSGYDIWYIERKGSGWSEPLKLPETVNSNLGETCPSVAANGNLYFSFTDKKKNNFIYCSKYNEGKYLTREKIKIELKSDIDIGSPFIAPDESYLLFQAIIPGGFGSSDIYVAFRNKNGSWKTPINLGGEINSKSSEIGPRVSFDGKYLFFTSHKGYETEIFKGSSYYELKDLLKTPQNGYGTLYWVNTDIIKELKRKNL